jgi:hypothetical protein
MKNPKMDSIMDTKMFQFNLQMEKIISTKTLGLKN